MGDSDLGSDRLLSTLPVDARGRPVIGGISLVRRIGAGGMGAVYLGEQSALRRQVAVKILPFTLAEQEPSIVSRFLGEARMAASLESDHVVRVLDVGCEHETHYFVMQYVNGESAGALIKRRRSETGRGLPEEVVLRLGLAASKGLAAAHVAGIVHRDVKPDNILIPEGRYDDAKIADLGLAKPESNQSTFGTLSHVAMGTPGFMAPEQGENAKAARPPADVFAMGATMYAMLQGFPPFRGSSLMAVMRAAAEEEPPPLPDTVSPGLRSLIAKCLRKKPADRYADGAALAAGLERVKANPRAVEIPLRVAKRPLAAAAPVRRSSSMVPWALALAGVGVLAVAVVMVSGRRDPEPGPPAPAPAPVASPTSTPDPLAELLAKADRFEREDRLDDALAALRQAAVLAPDDASIPKAKERIAAKLAGREDAASRERKFRDYRVAFDTLRLKAEGSEDPGAWDAAIEAAEKMAMYASDGAQKAEAAGNLKRARDRRQDAAARREARGRSEEARAARRKEYDARVAAARSQRDPAEALKLWREAAGFADEPAHLRESADAIAALEALAAAAERDREYLSSMDKGRVAYEAAKWEEAIAHLRAALEIRPGDAQAQRYLDEATEHLRKDPYVVGMNEAREAAAKGEWARARTAYETALRHRPGDPEATAGLADALKRITPAKVLVSGGRMEITLDDRVKFRLVQIREGTYQLGEGPTARAVTLLRPFWIATTEVTQAQWAALMDPVPCEFKGEDRPVERVSWFEAQSWLGRLTDRLPDHTAHLPTEAQWEAACRAGTRGPVYAGSSDSALRDCAWIRENSDQKSQTVGRKRANGWGLHDMLGNVWEWCSDWHEDPIDLRERVEPAGGHDTGRKSLRGGAWESPGESVTATARISLGPGERQGNAGFRFVLFEGPHPRARQERRTVFLDDAKKVAMEFVRLPKGAFLMGPNGGKPEEQHEVVLTRDFWIQTTEVTRAQWEAVMGSGKTPVKDPHVPASGISWTEAQDFIRRAAPRIAFGKPSLPTEAEWEYACRAGTKSKWFWGEDPAPAAEFGVFYGGKGLEPAGSRRPNPWGLHDMSGNVMEWCQDWSADLPRGQAVDPKGPQTGSARVLRGGWAGWELKDCSSGSRNAANPASKEGHLGFRLVVR